MKSYPILVGRDGMSLGNLAKKAGRRIEFAPKRHSTRLLRPKFDGKVCFRWFP